MEKTVPTLAAPVALGELLAAARLDGGGAAGVPVTGLDYDSRRIGPGFVFFAFAGARTDGLKFARQAMELGAVAVVSESAAPDGFDAPWIRAPHGRKALAQMARRFYANGAARVALTGITGTNGKTTTSCLLDTILRQAGHTTALVGTIEYHVAGEPRAAVNTTPESVDTYRLLDELAAMGGDRATMEVSSHALRLGRVWGFEFHTAVFTNLTRDHLDFHSSEADYFDAKCELFRGQDAAAPRWAVINADSEWSARIPLAKETQVIRFGQAAGADLRASAVTSGFEGLRFAVEWEGRKHRVSSPLNGSINVENILAAFGAGLSFGIAPEKIAQGVALRRSVPGRFERVDGAQPFLVVVDYAHTDDALARTIQVARGLTSGRVITLFGCGGDRDRAKRPRMGQTAGRLSDYVVLTSDNPRTEEPLGIINDALVGLQRTETPYRVELDRAAAIEIALREARRGDVVLLAGKGHETYQVLADRTIHFDDRETAAEVLERLGYGEA
ncbi:MAG: UDP-N-acetylmuramoyl-L-alanyl-D-glutamate--2,6-diaminopimelate ligase [Bryobacteraceae bacterium]